MKSKALIVGSLTFILATLNLNLAQAQSPQRQPTLSEGSDQYRVPSDEEIQLLKKDIKSKRKQIIAANMNLTDEQARSSGRYTNSTQQSSVRSTT